MEYNSSKENLEMPEYGRNVQLLVDYAKTIEDPEHRQAFAEKIIDLMQQMNPQNKSVEDYRTKLWRHIYQIAKFDLDVKSPTGEIPTQEEVLAKPEKVPYPQADTRFRHYGINVKRMIQKARDMEDEDKKAEFANVIASYMKLAYRTWNKEHFISDEVIKEDLLKLSEGELEITDSIYVDPVNQSKNTRDSKDNRRSSKRSNSSRSSSRSSSSRSNGKYSRNSNGKSYRRK